MDTAGLIGQTRLCEKNALGVRSQRRRFDCDGKTNSQALTVYVYMSSR